MKKAILLIYIIVSFVPFAVASDISRLPLNELPGKSDLIVLGEVTRVVPQDNENLDTVTIDIQAVIKGGFKGKEATFVLSSRGGLKDFDPRLKPGDKGVFFLNEKNGAITKAYWGSIALFVKDNFSTSSETDIPDDVTTIFPGIKLEKNPASLALIAKYALDQGWAPLGRDTLRIVVQPMGLVSGAYEIDLATGKVIVFQAARQNGPRPTFTLTDSGLENLDSILNSSEFRGLAPQNGKIGFDGTTYFIEVNLHGRYQWLLHWQPDEKIIETLVGLISQECLAQTKNR